MAHADVGQMQPSMEGTSGRALYQPVPVYSTRSLYDKASVVSVGTGNAHM